MKGIKKVQNTAQNADLFHARSLTWKRGQQLQECMDWDCKQFAVRSSAHIARPVVSQYDAKLTY
ncbi:MAG: hypothetical protein MHM6MM_007381 [Cercozoa sp. M6MM]